MQNTINKHNQNDYDDKYYYCKNCKEPIDKDEYDQTNGFCKECFLYNQ